jgi:peptidoglycan/xylan/chitin deacetylase (PgdA/CDA1 family)
MYHGVIDHPLELPDWCMLDANVFRNQINYLKQHFNIVSLSEAATLLENDCVTTPTAVITFDDGYQNNYDCAFSILREENVPATIFLTPNLIDTDQSIWTGTLHNALSYTQKPSLCWRNTTYDLSSRDKRYAALCSVKSQLKKESLSEINRQMEIIIALLSDAEPIRINKNSPYRILDTASIHAMLDSGLIEFGAHTLNHPILSNLSFLEQEQEILQSIEMVERITQKPCDFFAYPNGSRTCYNSDSISILENSRIKAALTTIEGTCSHTTPLMEWQRFGIGADMDMATFQFYIHNIINRFKTLLSPAAVSDRRA